MKHRKDVIRERAAKAKEQETICIDFDGVIHDHNHPIEGRRMGPPIDGAKEGISTLRKRYRIVVLTVWGGTESGQQVIKDWLKYYGIEVDEVTNIKRSAVAYIDDRAVKFISWKVLQI